MKTKLLLSTLSLIGLNAIAQVVPNVDWVRYYSERAQISNMPSAIDANNNVYTVGYSYVTPANPDLTILKYDASGVLVWVKHYDNGGYDDAKAITLDASSNIYVTGESDGTGTGRDIITIKYDVNGNQLWATRFNGTANGNDVANATVVDASGNVYVTGKTTSTAGGINYITIKYNASGVQQWVNTYNGTGNSADEAVSLDYSSTGRLFVTGTSLNASSNNDIVTLRINPSTGAQMWVKSINGSANANDASYALLADANDVVIVGSQNNTTTGDDYITLKYNGTNGNILWQKKYDFANSSNYATSITKDASGNYAVTGIALNSSIVEYHSLLYNASGVQQWVNKVSTGLTYSNTNPQIVVDPIANHFYVCGQKNENVSDIFVYQITPSGTKSWEQTFNGAQNNQDVAVDLVVNSQGIVYVAGASLNSNAKFDYTTIRISQTPVYFPPNVSGDSSEIGYQYIANQGQLLDYNIQQVPQVKYYTLSQNPKVYIEKTKNHFVYSHADTLQSTTDSISRLDIEFLEANQYANAFPHQSTDGYFNFFLSHLPQALTDLKGNKRLMVPNIWAGIDLHYYSDRNGIKYYFVLKQGLASLKNIRLKLSGQKSDNIINHDLVIDNFLKTLTLNRPKVYQIGFGGTAVSNGTGIWKNLSSSIYGIDSLTNIINGLPIVIEIQMDKKPAPTVASTTGINWSSMFQNGTMQNLRVSNQTGRQYVTGSTSDPAFPAQSSLITLYQSAHFVDAFVAQFNSNNVIEWATYYGGTGSSLPNKSKDVGMSVDFDSLGYVYVGGYTYADSIPTWQSTDPLAYFQPKNKYPVSPQNYSDGFLLKLNHLGYSDASNIHPEWCTMFGGRLDETFTDIRYHNHTIYAVGNGGYKDFTNPAYSTPFKYKAGAFNKDSARGNCSVYKFTETGQYTWGTPFIKNPATVVSPGYFTIDACDVYDLSTGQKNASGASIVGSGLVITGTSNGNGGFPNTIAGANLPNGGTSPTNDDAYIAIFDSNDNLAFASPIAGSDRDRGTDVVCVGAKSYVVGVTSSSPASSLKFPLKHATGDFIDSVATTLSEGFISEFDNITGLMLWSTYYGGNNTDYINGVAKDNLGNIYIHGSTSSNTGLYIPSSIPSNMYTQVANTFDETFVGSFNPSNHQFNWVTYFGGNGSTDDSKAIDVYKSSDVYVVGQGSFASGTFPTYAGTTGGYYSTTGNMYVSRLGITALYVGIKDLDNSKPTDNILIYPNPATDYINFQLKDATANYNIEIYNTLGQIAYVGSISQNNNAIDVSKFSNGLYVMYVTDKTKKYTAKFIKQ